MKDIDSLCTGTKDWGEAFQKKHKTVNATERSSPCVDQACPISTVYILWKLIGNEPLNSTLRIIILCVSELCRDGEPIENEEEDDDKHIFSDDSSELTIRNVDKNDEAEYVCIAENKAGEQDASIHLKVFGRYSAVRVKVTVQAQFLLLFTLYPSVRHAQTTMTYIPKATICFRF